MLLTLKVIRLPCLLATCLIFGCMPESRNLKSARKSAAKNSKTRATSASTDPRQQDGQGQNSSLQVPNKGDQNSDSSEFESLWRPPTVRSTPVIQRTGDPNSVTYLPDEALGAFQSELQNEPGGPVKFSCPGDSFMTGAISQRDPGSKDRTHRFLCSFFIDGRGMAMRKANCSLSEIIHSEQLEFACPKRTFLSGQNSWFHGTGQARSYQFECCEMRSPSGSKAGVARDTQEEEICTSEKKAIRPQYRTHPAYQPLININVNERHGDVNYSCKNAAILEPGWLRVNHKPTLLKNTVLKRVRIDHHNTGDGTTDGFYSYFCCALNNKE